MTKWKLNRFTMNEDVYIEERPERAAPLGSRDFYEKVNPFWTDRAADRAANPKQKAQVTSRKRLTNKK